MADTVALGLRFYTDGAAKVVMDQKAVAAASRSVEGQVVKTASATQAAGTAAAGASGGFRNFGMQLNQVAQVGGMTGNWMNAIAVQLPDMLLGFGAIGIYAGVLAGALIPVVSGLLGTGDAAKELEDAVDGLSDSTSAYVDAVDQLKVSLHDTYREWGAQTTQVIALRNAMVELTRIEFLGKLAAASQSLGASLGDIATRINNIDQLGQIDGPLRADAIAVIRQEMQLLEKEFGVGAAEAARIRDALDSWAAASGPAEVADAAVDLREAIMSATDEAGNLPPELLEAAKTAAELEVEARRAAVAMGDVAAVDAATNIGAAADEAARLGGNLVAALSSAQAIGGYLPMLGRFSPDAAGLGSPLAVQTSPRPQQPGVDSYGDFIEAGKPKKSGGGGMSPAEKQMKEDLREAERIFNDTRTAAEEYAAEMANLDALLQKGHITQDTYNRAVKDLDAEFSETAAAAKSAADAVRGAFDGIFDDPAAALENLAKGLLKLLLYAQLARSLPSVFGAGGIIPLTGGRASGGSVSAGGLYQVNERGQELFVPSSNGTIMPAGLGGGGADISIHNYGGQDDVKVQRSKGPDGREMVRVIVKEEWGRGSFDGVVQQRNGIGTQKVRR